jgi:hypothetical protein
MLRNSNNPGRLSMNAGNSALRWRSVFIALVLALTIGSAGQISPAQAAPARSTNLRFELKPYPEGPLTISECEFVHFDVIVSKEEQVVLFGRERPVYSILSGVNINGSVQNSNIGTLRPPKSSTGFEDDDTAAAGFTFTPKKAGKTTITFKATVGTYWVGDAQEKNAKQIEVPDKMVQVTVTPCKFKVTTISSWSAGMDIVAAIDDAVMKADEQGHFTGSANVNWVTSIIGGPGCGAKSTVAPGKADLTGEINESDQLVGKVTFQPVSASGFAACAGVGISTGNSGIADPLTINVASSGGVSRQAEVSIWKKGGSVTGSAIIIVIPEDCSGTASC